MISDEHGRPIGAIAATLDGGVVRIDSVTIASDVRGFGLGGEAVRLFEKWATDRGATRFQARVEEANGLGVYFLLRLGYRPGDAHQTAVGAAALEMIREVE